jgi:hypothetical protein
MSLDALHFDHADRIFLEACRDCGGELQLIICREGSDDPDASAMRDHVETMVKRGYLARVTIGGSRSRMQGAALRVIYRAHGMALALLEAVEQIEALETELAALNAKPTPRRRSTSAA